MKNIFTVLLLSIMVASYSFADSVQEKEAEANRHLMNAVGYLAVEVGGAGLVIGNKVAEKSPTGKLLLRRDDLIRHKGKVGVQEQLLVVNNELEMKSNLKRLLTDIFRRPVAKWGGFGIVAIGAIRGTKEAGRVMYLDDEVRILKSVSPR